MRRRKQSLPDYWVRKATGTGEETDLYPFTPASNLVKSADDWQWGSLWIREFGDSDHRKLLSNWPVRRSRQWIRHINQPIHEKELEGIRRSCNRGTPYGSDEWVNKTIKKFGLESTRRIPGRPRKL